MLINIIKYKISAFYQFMVSVCKMSNVINIKYRISAFYQFMVSVCKMSNVINIIKYRISATMVLSISSW